MLTIDRWKTKFGGQLETLRHRGGQSDAGDRRAPLARHERCESPGASKASGVGVACRVSVRRRGGQAFFVYALHQPWEAICLPAKMAQGRDASVALPWNDWRGGPARPVVDGLDRMMTCKAIPHAQESP
jgi:hypothetical protein